MRRTSRASSSDAGAQTAAAATPGRRVVDAPTRMFHALIALGFAGAYLSAESERWRTLHAALGYMVTAVLLLRLLYGLVGPRQARVVQWARKLAAGPDWLHATARALRVGRVRDVAWRPGQNLLMAALVVALLLTLLPLLASGLALDLPGLRGGLADLVAELHEALAEGALALAGAHVACVLGMSLLRRRNLARPMLSGRTADRGPDLVRRDHGLLALLALAVAVSVLAWRWQAGPGATQSERQDAAYFGRSSLSHSPHCVPTSPSCLSFQGSSKEEK